MSSFEFTETGTSTAAAAGGSLLGRLAERAQRDLAGRTVDLPVPDVAGTSVRYSTNLSFEAHRGMQLAAADSDMPLGYHPLLYALNMATDLCRAIVVDGEVVTGGDGKPVTFTSTDFQAALGAHDAHSAVLRLYGVEGDVIRVGASLQEATGFDPTKGLDPTRG